MPFDQYQTYSNITNKKNLTSEDLEIYKSYISPENKPELFSDLITMFRINALISNISNQKLMNVRDLKNVKLQEQVGSQLFRYGDNHKVGDMAEDIRNNGYNLSQKGVLILLIPKKYTKDKSKDIKIIIGGNSILLSAEQAGMENLPVTVYTAISGFVWANLGKIGTYLNGTQYNPLNQGQDADSIKKAVVWSLAEQEIKYVENNDNYLHSIIEKEVNEALGKTNLSSTVIRDIKRDVFEELFYDQTGQNYSISVDKNRAGDHFKQLQNSGIAPKNSSDTVYIFSNMVVKQAVHSWQVEGQKLDTKDVQDLKTVLHFGSSPPNKNAALKCCETWEKFKTDLNKHFKWYDQPLGLSFQINPTSIRCTMSAIYIQTKAFDKYGLECNSVVSIARFEEVSKKVFAEDNKLSKNNDFDELDGNTLDHAFLSDEFDEDKS